ncbi:MAG TPA: hypothetical protein VGV37_04370 [Aliidongia sp.]|uniref:hypothetical protein n=1 Tax=Aliidongia sp. TaxID=1914230 RepID=UPI002DDD0F42|nr:hypothetical protein [Aliidongia sp.]HEV2673752.1 hypothetical protein [Aliidongia sp.]
MNFLPHYKRMRAEEKTAIAGIFLGSGVTLAAAALPLAYPHESARIWQILTWGGLLVITFSIVFLVYEHAAKPLVARTRPKKLSAAPFVIKFIDDSHAFGRAPIYTQRCNIGVEGRPLGEYISAFLFQFRIVNISSTTIRNIGIFATKIIYGEYSYFDCNIPMPRIPNVGLINLQPGASEFFPLIEIMELQFAGMFSFVKFVETEAIAKWRWLLEPGMISTDPVGAGIPTIAEGYPIHRPSAIGGPVTIEIAIYADDSPPTHARFKLTAKDMTSVELVSQGLSLPEIPCGVQLAKI